MKLRTLVATLFSIGAVVAASGVVDAQTMSKASTSLGSVKLGKSVMADGKPLAAGTYTLRVSDEMPAAVVGQTPGEARWIEFLQGGQVKGREIATVLSKDALKEMMGKSAPPASGSVKVERLKGDDYFRVWINHAGTQYLIHLAAQ